MPVWLFIVLMSVVNHIIVALIWVWLIMRFKRDGDGTGKKDMAPMPEEGELKVFRENMEGLVDDLNLRISESMPEERKRFSAKASGNAVLFSFGEKTLSDEEAPVVAEASADPQARSVHCVFIYKGADEYVSCGEATIIKAFARMRYNLLQDYVMAGRAS